MKTQNEDYSNNTMGIAV